MTEKKRVTQAQLTAGKIPKEIKDLWAPLTDNQKEMIRHYVKYGNKVRAYFHAYNCDTSKKSARRNAYLAFDKPAVVAMVDAVNFTAIKKAEVKIEEVLSDKIDHLVDEHRDLIEMQIDKAWVLKRAALLADFNINKFIKVSGGAAYYDFSEATDDDWYCISEYTVDEINKGSGDDKILVDRVKLKTVDKLKALEAVGKHVDVAAFRDNIGIGGDPDNDTPVQTVTRRIVKSDGS